MGRGHPIPLPQPQTKNITLFTYSASLGKGNILQTSRNDRQLQSLNRQRTVFLSPVESVYRFRSDHCVFRLRCNSPNVPQRYNLKNARFFAKFRILGIKNCWGAGPCPMRYALASVGQWSSFTNCEIFRGQRPLASEI